MSRELKSEMATSDSSFESIIHITFVIQVIKYSNAKGKGGLC